MAGSARSVPTRFRAYQLGQHGSSFSYAAGDHFTLIEAVITDVNRAQLRSEMAACAKETLDTLHITSWDQDHCDEASLEWILKHLAPAKIEHPGYDPHTDCGKNSLKMIEAYRKKWASKGHSVKVQAVTPPYIASLSPAQGLGYTDVFYHPKSSEKSPTTIRQSSSSGVARSTS